MLHVGKVSKSDFISFAALMFILILLEFSCAIFAYYWVGAINSVLLQFAVALNIIPILFYLCKRPMLGVVSALLLASVLVPDSLITGAQLFFLQREAGSIVSYLYQTKLKTGNYPKDLSGYTYLDPKVKDNFDYSVEEKGSFRVAYTTTGSTTLFWYRPQEGWMYYDD